MRLQAILSTVPSNRNQQNQIFTRLKSEMNDSQVLELIAIISLLFELCAKAYE